MTKRIFAIGDVHGCVDELRQLLEITDRMAKPEDLYVFLGDYVDRGPDSKGVVDVLIERKANHAVPHRFITGNHEQMMLERVDYWALNGGLETLKSYGIDLEAYAKNEDYTALFPANHLAFYRSLELFVHVGRTVCVHAGIDPGKCLMQQRERDMVWAREWVGYNGPYAGDYFVAFGHTPKYQVVEKANQVNLDTACVFGGSLTCGVIDAQAGKLETTVSVKSGFNW